MKISLPRKLMSLVLAISLFSNFANAGVEPIPTGSFIVNMGVVPQTYGNGIKPWGLVYDLIKNHRVQVKWVVSQSKGRNRFYLQWCGLQRRYAYHFTTVQDRSSQCAYCLLAGTGSCWSYHQFCFFC